MTPITTFLPFLDLNTSYYNYEVYREEEGVGTRLGLEEGEF